MTEGANGGGRGVEDEEMIRNGEEGTPHAAITASRSFFIEYGRRLMTASAAPPTFSSPLSRKGTANMTRRYIFFFFLFVSSLFFLTLPPHPAAGSQ